MSFVVAMLLYPEIQKKAQGVLDSVTRRERLPTFEDRLRLPFIDAICKEVLRWRPVFPIGVSPKRPVIWDIWTTLRLYRSHCQVSRMHPSKMTCMRASSYRKVSPIFRTNLINVTLRIHSQAQWWLAIHGGLQSLYKHALIIAWTFFREILHDPAFYPEPDIFKPERFLNPDGTLRDDPMLISGFGFGKRMCPGRHLVDATLFISVVSLLSVFNLERGRDG